MSTGIPPYWEPIRRRPGFEYMSDEGSGLLKRLSDGAVVRYHRFLLELVPSEHIGVVITLSELFDIAEEITNEQWEYNFQSVLEIETFRKLKRL